MKMKMKMKMKGRLIFLLLIMTLGLKASDNLAKMEAMFIYNFTRLVQWPEGNTNNEFVIGIYGNDEIYDALIQYTQNRRVGNRIIQVKYINSTEESKNCQLVFFPAQNISKIKEVKEFLGSHPCMIIGEKEGSNSYGATIEFLQRDNKLKFRVNKDAAKSQNLLISGALIDMSV